jgi:hypothetical protein
MNLTDKDIYVLTLLFMDLYLILYYDLIGSCIAHLV